MAGINIFGKTADQLVFELIAQDNPDLTPVLTAENSYITSLATNTGADAAKYNTVATINCRSDKGITGKQVIKYNRISLADLFVNIKPTITIYYSSNLKRSDVIIGLGQKYNIDIKGTQSGDTTYAGTLNPGSTKDVSITLNNANKAFIGSLLVTATGSSSKTVADLTSGTGEIYVDVIADPYPPIKKKAASTLGVYYPAPETFFKLFDFTEIASSLWPITATYPDAALCALLTQVTSLNFQPTTYPTVTPTDDSPFCATFNWLYVTKGTTASLVGTYPFVDTSFSHCHIYKLRYDPESTTGGVAQTGTRYFALHYNWAV